MNVQITGIFCVQFEDAGDGAALVAAVRAAMRESAIDMRGKGGLTTGLFLGSTFSNYRIRKDNAEKYHSKGVRVLNPADFPKCLISYLGGVLCTALCIKGVNSTVSSGQSSGIDALVQGVYFLRRNAANKAIVLEFDEDFGKRGAGLHGVVVFVLERASGSAGGYGTILGIESFFDSPGNTQGLKRAYRALRAKLPSTQPDAFYCAEPATVRAAHILEAGAAGVRRCRKGLFGVADFLTSNREAIRRNALPVALFFSAGKNANSNCLAVSAKKKESTRGHKKRQRETGKKSKD